MSPEISTTHRTLTSAELPPTRWFFLLGGFAAILIATYGSLVPFELRSMTFSRAWQYFWHNQNWGHPEFRSRSDWGANILLFIPMGFCWLGAVNLDRNDRLRKTLNAGIVFAGCLLSSLAIEFSQCWFAIRVPSHNDVYAQVVGALTGIGLWMCFGQAVVNWWREQTSTGRSTDLLTSLLSVYLVGLLAYSLIPLDFITQPSEIYQKYKAGRIELLPTSLLNRDYLWSNFTNLVLFVPVGIWSALVRSEPEQRRSWISCLMIGASVAVLIESAQLFLLSRFTETADVLTGLAGVALGTLGVRQFQQRSRTADTQVQRPVTAPYWLFAAIVYGGFLFCYFCWPLEFDHNSERIRHEWSRFFRPPMTALFWSDPLNAATQILQKLTLWAILGVLLGRAIINANLPRAVRRMSFLLALAVCAGLGMGIELIQLLVPVHTPDSTDVALYLIGALCGVWVSHFWHRSNDPIQVNNTSYGCAS